MKPLTASLTALAALLSASALHAQTAASAKTGLTAGQIVQKLESLGYTSIEEVEQDDGLWEVEATAANGTRVEIELDPTDGRIVRERPDKD